jgi:hypothetical protein
MDILTQMAEQIMKRQEKILGPVALKQAMKVQGLRIDPQTYQISLEGDKKEILGQLVSQYEKILGKMAIDISKEAVKGIVSQVPPDQVPQILL